MIDIENEKLLTMEEAAEILGCKSHTVRKNIIRGYHGIFLDALKVGKLYRTSIEAIQRFSAETLAHDRGQADRGQAQPKSREKTPPREKPLSHEDQRKVFKALAGKPQ